MSANLSELHLAGWRGPGCTAQCWPRSHDPVSHENYGRAQALNELRTRVVRTGPLVVDLEASTVHVSGKEIIVSGREWQMLAYLAQHVGAFCATQDIVRAVWGVETSVDEKRVLIVALSRLRERLGNADYLIVTLNRHGCPGRRLEQVEPT